MSKRPHSGDDSLFYILDVSIVELEVGDETQALLQAGENGEFAIERVLSEQKIKRSRSIVRAVLPVCVRHGYLVRVHQ